MMLTRLCNVPAWFVRVLILVIVALALAMVLWPTKVYAAPRIQAREDCMVVADMAVVARALAIDKVSIEQSARIMGLIYKVSDDGAELMRLITDAAYRQEGSAGDFAKLVMGECLGKRGNLDGILGTSL